jgi:uncharacterized protein (TIGR02996 family)
MSDEKALLAAIWERPQDDALRLVYADWLEESGQPERAEFIRLQLELARLDEWDDARPALEKREKKALKKFEKAWRTALPPDVRGEPFVRGFVAPGERRYNARRFCDLAASAFASAPAWDYYLEGAAEGLAGLARCAHLRRVGRLKFWVSAGPAETAKMLASPHLRNVRVLSLGHGAEWAEALPALAANAAAEALAELEVQEGLDDASVEVLASSPAFAKLRAFGVYQHEVTPEGIRALFNSPHLSGLTELTLPAWYGEEGARAIAGTAPKFRLRKLILYGAWMTDAGVALIANWPGLATVRSLSIGGECAVVGPRALASSPHAANLRELDLGLSRLSRAGALALARSKTLNLKRLLIRMTPAGDDETAVAALVKRFGKDAVKARYPGQRKR